MSNVPLIQKPEKKICSANELTGFYMMGKLVLDGSMYPIMQKITSQN